ncbi:MAG: carbamoyl phosphate synthase small subunit [Bacteroidetes bacterium RIFCSPLOWO2_02_FULL_36_8]|nr:MAG: carbamoyl phosphate synthase small subunit [Bacteroidetes bacterium RIFCSPLOWO2_02_FULL_36_8]OFY69521.1 MAG: carbamoyl phosphate synthase small subunit [Bacteroidetes bacterium RIFCSPLOWO2_12_FULL_37_12]
MPYTTKKPAVLLLDDGTLYRGFSVGAPGTATGEICFNTGMTGYQEVFTDPSYSGQIMTTTHVHIGNYGVHKEEAESSKVQIAGLVCRSFQEMYSRNDGDLSLQEYFLLQNITAIDGIDTRALVRHIRSKGAMNAIISSEKTDTEELNVMLKSVPSMAGLELSSKVSTTESYFYGDENGKFRVAALDFGIKKNILRNFDERGCYVKIFPAKTKFEELKSFEPHGFFLSNGPGDPAAMPYAVETVTKILESGKPLFGICLGHQLLALAAGVSTYKMHHGHRGLNHPVKNLQTGRCEITSQNHGFSVSEESIRKNKNVEVTHLNLNDKTIEGLQLKDRKAFSVQYHPESSPGPHDSRYLFDRFVGEMGEG